jgi:hypothetical protein
MKKSVYLLLAAFLLVLPASKADAQIAEQACDPGYFQQLTARAWMEAEREIMQNQNLIFKADSVLEYTCFDQFVSLATWPGGNIFTHSDYFSQKVIPRGSPYALERTMTSVIYNALVSYRDENFEHTYLGGRSQHMDAEQTNSEFKSPMENQAYTCTTMANIWKTAKCANFVDNENFEDTDGFYPFMDLKGFGEASSDIAGYETIINTRKWPDIAPYPCGNDLGPGGDWNAADEFANNIGEPLYQFQTPLGELYMEVGERLIPGVCTDPILTGVTVKTVGSGTWADGVCTNPGCVYAKSESCVPSGGGSGDGSGGATRPGDLGDGLRGG